MALPGNPFLHGSKLLRAPGPASSLQAPGHTRTLIRWGLHYELLLVTRGRRQGQDRQVTSGPGRRAASRVNKRPVDDEQRRGKWVVGAWARQVAAASGRTSAQRGGAAAGRAGWQRTAAGQASSSWQTARGARWVAGGGRRAAGCWASGLSRWAAAGSGRQAAPQLPGSTCNMDSSVNFIHG
ncbi:hypothetical protein GGX14DRAFT_384131 [Mycena pura]|uniref:Uncharacterized protein n=1 Tax=Mycena pura TaxID=153505 RepID=A0AAD6YVG1_9AGAR|nr:hypothetical protein GGX14DRAFT_384131 [Mycena pura]